MSSRRTLLTAAGAAVAAPLLTACGFELRKPPVFAFKSIALAMPPSSSLTVELRRQLEGTGSVKVITEAAELPQAEVVLESPGEVRELTLRIRLRFRLRTADGRELLPMTEISRQIDQSYAESAALSKEQEGLMLYQNMQSDIVQQVMRRLATVHL